MYNLLCTYACVYEYRFLFMRIFIMNILCNRAHMCVVVYIFLCMCVCTCVFFQVHTPRHNYVLM